MPSSILREGSKGAGKAEDFIGSDITALRICFRANGDIRITASGKVLIVYAGTHK